MTVEISKKVALVLGSTRAIRVGPNVLEFVKKAISTSSSANKATLTTIDIGTFNLPIFDEKVLPKMVPAHAQLEHEHSKKWSEAIKPYDGYIIVTPEYHGGIPGGLKNALDYLYHETQHKPAVIVSYGGHGGSQVSSHLKDVLERIEMKVVETRPQLAFAGFDETVVAATTGKLGEPTLTAWGKENEALVVKAFEELVTALEAEVSPADPAK
ncbi:uncharacterized protein LY89DRAFT_684811 [Mollisia scopiformis]|uniref:NADPH-dependent FMN reductase-like domain-containing protein n=1 Tax=Mollisia scopiformis TaxID=149040 RepID=A0A194X9E2_MOLSC|nr:uncharacterized protein LY89DRAFT_684811 [Mollisia scopiformis]KUJ16739.1 hypothetical protein LY89DRAFT_684811 [Mollisia scopiformis]